MCLYFCVYVVFHLTTNCVDSVCFLHVYNSGHGFVCTCNCESVAEIYSGWHKRQTERERAKSTASNSPKKSAEIVRRERNLLLPIETIHYLQDNYVWVRTCELQTAISDAISHWKSHIDSWTVRCGARAMHEGVLHILAACSNAKISIDCTLSVLWMAWSSMARSQPCQIYHDLLSKCRQIPVYLSVDGTPSSMNVKLHLNSTRSIRLTMMLACNLQLSTIVAIILRVQSLFTQLC